MTAPTPIAFDARTAATWAGGELLQGSPDAKLAGVTIDSRAVQAGQLFVAIVGPKNDGHDYLVGACERGAAGLLVDARRTLPPALAGSVPVVAVGDTTAALGRLARGHRAGFAGPVVAITGSNGKTTTKEMCAAILGVDAPCLKNAGNLNNQFGLPLTLLRRAESDASVVVELGMNHRGEIAQLVAIAQPTVGLITNVGTAHIEHLGSREAIALVKGDLVAALPASATAVLNANDPAVAAQAERTLARVLFYGTDARAQLRAIDPSWHGDGGWKFELETPQGRVAIEVPGLGETAWRNALAAAAGAFAAGASLDQIATGLAHHRPVAGRLVPIVLASGAVVIDDTYNANPQSMGVALRLLAGMARGKRRFAVLGDMGELGETAVEAHRGSGRLAAELGIEFLFALGDHAGETVEAARAGGMSSARAVVGRDADDVAAQLQAVLREGDHVLVKGSRAMRMERVVKSLRGDDATVEEC